MCPVSAADICPDSTEDIYPVPTEDQTTVGLRPAIVMSSVYTRKMPSVTTGQMSAVETEQMSAVEMGPMSFLETECLWLRRGRRPPLGQTRFLLPRLTDAELLPGPRSLGASCKDMPSRELGDHMQVGSWREGGLYL